MSDLSARIEADGERRAELGWTNYWQWEGAHWTDWAICPRCGGNGCPACDGTGEIWQGHNPTWDREEW